MISCWGVLETGNEPLNIRSPLRGCVLTNWNSTLIGTGLKITIKDKYWKLRNLITSRLPIFFQSFLSLNSIFVFIPVGVFSGSFSSKPFTWHFVVKSIIFFCSRFCMNCALLYLLFPSITHFPVNPFSPQTPVLTSILEALQRTISNTGDNVVIKNTMLLRYDYRN